ncbi:hypothetical protein Xaut_3255 [Xanthobacter versatilis]|uniref:Uncharacterized protein n=1 Tax=Xanthobacter autotrophicus (strain ATCC BAA-1158 / Py2) TaxID=78245 RepID=A7IKE1_XANP2|nr:hypothetical protein Xaut_3255 [Xanthobacter autotrophicus Py2]
MRMIAIHAQTERKRLDRSVRCAEKRRPWARKQRLRGLIRPDPAVCATAGAACGRKSLSSARIQALFTSNDTPLGECRLNPFLAALAPFAEFARGQRTPRNEDGPHVAAEHFMATAITAGFDFYRQTRDATVETEFFRLYGTLAMLDPDLTAPTTPAIVEQSPVEVASALASLREGGFTDAAVRVALLAQKRGGGQQRLSILKQIRELVGHEVGLLALPADDAQAIIRRQSIIVEHAPDEALATLPALLPTPEARAHLLTLLDRLLANIAFGPDVNDVVADVKRVLAEGPAGQGAEGQVIPFPSYAGLSV